MTEALSLLRVQVRRFLAREFAPHRERWDREGVVERAAWLKAGAAGLLCAGIPEVMAAAARTPMCMLTRAQKIYAGSNEVMKMLIARAL